MEKKTEKNIGTFFEENKKKIIIGAVIGLGVALLTAAVVIGLKTIDLENLAEEAIQGTVDTIDGANIIDMFPNVAA